MRNIVNTSQVPEKHAERRFARRVLTLLALGFAAVLATVIVSGFTVRRAQDQTQWLVHTYQVERQVVSIRLSLERLRSGRRGTIIGLPGSRETYEAAKNDLIGSIAQVRALTADNPVQQGNLARLDAATRALTTALDQSIALGEGRNKAQEPARQRLASTVQHIAETMLAEETLLSDKRNREIARSTATFYAILVAMIVLVAGIGAGSFLIIRRYTEELSGTRDELRLLNTDLEGAVRERTTDLQRANDEIQRFAYIVSHDLRSPLVNIMGFTAELDASTKPLAQLIEHAEEQAPDLVTPEARLAATEDLPEAIRFIRSSTEKMDRLINAILRLSREGRRPITPEPIALADLVNGIFDSLHHRIDHGGITTEVGKLPTIVTDRVSIEQILSNIIENAVKYLKPDTPGHIAVQGTQRGDRVTILIQDNGRGIEKRDHDRIFDLFRRSGTQDQPGEGIGLAHVRALAYRLGGTIDVESELGSGSIFKVNLPARFAGERGVDR
jgi:signal transduction histidine kinase